MQLKNDLFSGTYPLIYSDVGLFLCKFIIFEHILESLSRAYNKVHLYFTKYIYNPSKAICFVFVNELKCMNDSEYNGNIQRKHWQLKCSENLQHCHNFLDLTYESKFVLKRQN